MSSLTRIPPQVWQAAEEILAQPKSYRACRKALLERFRDQQVPSHVALQRRALRLGLRPRTASPPVQPPTTPSPVQIPFPLVREIEQWIVPVLAPVVFTIRKSRDNRQTTIAVVVDLSAGPSRGRIIAQASSTGARESVVSLAFHRLNTSISKGTNTVAFIIGARSRHRIRRKTAKDLAEKRLDKRTTFLPLKLVRAEEAILSRLRGRIKTCITPIVRSVETSNAEASEAFAAWIRNWNAAPPVEPELDAQIKEAERLRKIRERILATDSRFSAGS